MPVLDLPMTEIDYTNWRGERSFRRVQIEQIVYKESQWHAGRQWMVRAYDGEKGAMREFAIGAIHSCRVEGSLSSHGEEGSLEQLVEEIRCKIKERGDLAGFPVAVQEVYLDEMAGFELGQFYLRNRGLDGHWIDYIVSHPDCKEERKNLCPAERFLLEEAPLALATQERHRTFHKVIRDYAKPGMTLASVPCGVMGELLLPDLPDVHLIGVDLDPLALIEAAELTEKAGLAEAAVFHLRDAWKLGMEEEVDLLTSNGLSVYVADDEAVVALLQEFYRALKPGGLLITSTLTPPPLIDPASEWRLSEIDPEALALQKLIITDIAQAKFAAFRSSEKMAQMLIQAGFEEPEVISDRAGLFPTLIAHKCFSKKVLSL